MNDKIMIRGARVNNLKNIDLDLPRNKMIVMTGLSGSGKTSLAFDTIYAEGQRSLSRTGKTCHDDHFVSRQIQIDILQIIDSGASDDDLIVHFFLPSLNGV